MTEVAMQLVIDRLSSIEAQMREDRTNATASRARMYEKLDLQNQTTRVLADRVESLERTMLDVHPTVQEFIAFKTRAQIAGRLGAFLWRLGGVLLSAAAGAAAMWAAFWAHFQWR